MPFDCRKLEAPPARVRRCFRGGFTLVELLIVIALIATVISISAPSFVGLGREAGMNGSVRSLQSTLALLRQWAITHREQVTFHYHPGGLNETSYYYAVNAAGGLIEKTNALPSDVIFGADDGVGEPHKFTFKTDGGLGGNVGAATKKVTIIDRKAYSIDTNTPNRKTLAIRGITGSMRVE